MCGELELVCSFILETFNSGRSFIVGFELAETDDKSCAASSMSKLTVRARESIVEGTRARPALPPPIHTFCRRSDPFPPSLIKFGHSLGSDCPIIGTLFAYFCFFVGIEVVFVFIMNVMVQFSIQVHRGTFLLI
jgi:hypothetical protein